MTRPILVTGRARAGTAYLSALLTRLAIPCGHERIFAPETHERGTPEWPEGVSAESSWLAAPFVGGLANGTVVVHTVREPVAALRSLWRVGLFRTRSSYRSHAERHCRALTFGTPMELTARFWLRWNELAESARDVRGLRYVRVRLDAIDESTVRWIGELAEREIDPTLARRALAAVPRDTNTAGDSSQDAAVDWSAMTSSALASQIDELAARYGFGGRAMQRLWTRAA